MVFKLPSNLLNQGFRFVKVTPKGKNPIETGWPNLTPSPQEIEGHVQQGGNYGLLSGYGDLVILDTDSEELEAIAAAELPETFTVSTKKGKHRYYRCKALAIERKKSLSVNGSQAGDFQSGGNNFVVGPGSIHPSGRLYSIERDISVAEVSREDLAPMLALVSQSLPDEKSKDLHTYDKFGLSMQSIIEHYGMELKTHGHIAYGAHPIHGSTNGKNFHIDLEKDVFFCFRHWNGAGPLQLIAMMEELLDCEEGFSGTLRGELFKKAARIAEKKFDIIIPMVNKVINGPKRLTDEELEELSERIRGISSGTPKEKLSNALASIIGELARLEEPQAEGFLTGVIKEHFALTNKDIDAYRAVLKEKRKTLNIEQEMLSEDDVLKRLKEEENKTTIHPAQDFVDGVLYMGRQLNKQSIPGLPNTLMVIDSNRKRYLSSDLRLKQTHLGQTNLSSFVIEAFTKNKANGAEPVRLFNRLKSYIGRFVYFTDQAQIETIVLWLMGTYCYTAFEAYPYLWITAEKGSGKSTLLKVMNPLCFNGDLLVSITPAVLFRKVQAQRPTLLIDEVETLTKGNKDNASALFDVLNSGYMKGLSVERASGKDFALESFDVYGPKVFSGINEIDDVLKSRTIPVQLLKKSSATKLERYKVERNALEIIELQKELYLFALTYAPRIAELYNSGELEKTLPLINRELDLWEPLMAIVSLLTKELCDLEERLLQFAKASENKKSLDDYESNPSLMVISQIIELLESNQLTPDKEENLYKAPNVFNILKLQSTLRQVLPSQAALSRLLNQQGLQVKQQVRFEDGSRETAYTLSLTELYKSEDRLANHYKVDNRIDSQKAVSA